MAWVYAINYNCIQTKNDIIVYSIQFNYIYTKYAELLLHSIIYYPWFVESIMKFINNNYYYNTICFSRKRIPFQ